MDETMSVWTLVFKEGRTSVCGTREHMTYRDILETHMHLEQKPITLLKNGRVVHDGDFDAVLERYYDESHRLRSKLVKDLRELFPEPTR